MGIPVSINTDDPKMFGNCLSEEYQVLKDSFDFSDEEINTIILNSIHTTWLDEKDKVALIKEFREDLK